MMVLRHLVSILILPFTMVVLFPGWLLRGASRSDTRWIDGTLAAATAHIAGALIFLGGFALFAWCVSLFARIGQGTLAPWDPTKRLIVVGPYRFIRNPMITGVLAMLAGETLFLGSRVIGAWTLTFFVINTIYFLLHEEPGLERRFGPSYLEYKGAVGRWLPVDKPWKNV
jgi:protein-S-isoprenylcysteine O-methyltransferase Ste14